MTVYIIVFFTLHFAPEGNCWASTHGDMTPLFENPPKKDNIDWRNIQLWNETRVENKDEYTNVTDRIKFLLFLEICFAIFFQFKSIIALMFKLKKGRMITKVLDKSNYFMVGRFVVLGLLTFKVFSFEGQLCLCEFREYFFNHCYYDNRDFS